MDNTTSEDSTMDRLSTDELGFDDNGLQNASLQAYWQEIVSSDCILENSMVDYQLNHCDAIPPERDAAESTDIATEQWKSYCKVPLEDERETNSFGESAKTSALVNDEENKPSIPNEDKDSKKGGDEKHNLNLPVCHTIEMEGPQGVYGRSPIRSGEVETKGIQLRSGRSAKDGGFLKSHTNLEILSSLATFWVTSFVTISMRFSISLTVGILVLMPSVGVGGALTSVPVSTLFVVGKTARLNCSTDLSQPVYWARTLTGSDVQHWLYYGRNGFNGNNADGRFSIDKDEATGRYDLIIEDVQPKDAGQYVCVDDSGIGVGASAEVVVAAPINCKSRIPSDGVMGYNVFGLKQDFIQFSCNLTYAGNLSPTLEWSWPGSEVESDEPMISVSASSVASTLKLSPTKERDNVKFQCKASIERAIQNSTDSGLLWESETVSVRYAEFESTEVDVCIGVKWNVVCNPQCSYHYERNGQSCQCIYTYLDVATQQYYQVASDAVKCDKGIIPNVLIAFAVVAALLVVGLAIFVLAYCLKRKKTKGRSAGDWEESCQIRNDDTSRKAMIETS